MNVLSHTYDSYAPPQLMGDIFSEKEGDEARMVSEKHCILKICSYF